MKSDFEKTMQLFASELVTPLSKKLKKKSFIYSKSDQEYHTRIEIYRWDIRRRFKDCLREDYPALLELVGDEKFDKWAEDYFLKHPSRSYSLSDYSRAFSDFLRAKREKSLFVDLANWEWNDCLLAWTSLSWKKIPFAQGDLKINRTLIFLQSFWPLEKIENKRRIFKKSSQKNFYIQYRHSGGLGSLKLKKWEFLILNLLFNGKSLEESMLQIAEKLELLPRKSQVSSTFSRWVTHEILSLDKLS